MFMRQTLLRAFVGAYIFNPLSSSSESSVFIYLATRKYSTVYNKVLCGRLGENLTNAFHWMNTVM